ncbi:MAG: hypothetical protein MJ145_05245 [Clostridia bacterium]|nr:hypothetical protein [Clostridia bacterium]
MQDGDMEADITAEEQQTITVEKILELISTR